MIYHGNRTMRIFNGAMADEGETEAFWFDSNLRLQLFTVPGLDALLLLRLALPVLTIKSRILARRALSQSKCDVLSMSMFRTTQRLLASMCPRSTSGRYRQALKASPYQPHPA